MPSALPMSPFTQIARGGDRVLAQAPEGALELKPLAPGVLRVRVGRGEGPLPDYRSAAMTGGDLPGLSFEFRPAPEGSALMAEGLAAVLQAEPPSLQVSRGAGEPVTDFAFALEADHLVVHGAYGVHGDERVYGLGEKVGALDKRHRRWLMRNTDVLLVNPVIGPNTDPLYASFPVFFVHSAAGTYGVYVDNTEYTRFDFANADQPGARYAFAAPAPVLTFYVLLGPDLPAVLRQYTALTGRMPLPALWTLGYHQCRWGYRTEADFRRVAAELRERGLPADALWFDIDYMDGYRVFTWDPERMANAPAMIADLRQLGLRCVTIVDPGVKVDEDYRVYQQGRVGGHFIRHPDGREYVGAVWPGPSAFPDFHAPGAHAWWRENVRQWLASTGLAGLWNDMNEPASTDISGPVAEVLHAGGTLPHPSARNTYGLEMARATYAGMLEHAPDSRPFILTRAAFSGAQTVTALWGGDNSAVWEHLSGSLPYLLNLGLSGMPFVGVDIGGFQGDSHGELLARWFQAGVFYPFCRNHAETGTNFKEPWAFGPRVEAICRRYLELRYQLLPYAYSLFREAAQTGAPIMRPLVWHYPDDPQTFNLSDQFLYGRDLLVAPVTTPGLSARAVYLPRGTWYRWGSDQPLEGPGHILAAAPLEELPLYVRGGALLPMWPAAAHTGALDRAAMRVHLWPGDGALDLYEDDGETRAYTRGDWRLTPFRLEPGDAGLALTWDKPSGAYPSPRAAWTFVLHGLKRARVALDGQRLRLKRAPDGLTFSVLDDGEPHRVLIQK